jgi:hypothetical protein
MASPRPGIARTDRGRCGPTRASAETLLVGQGVETTMAEGPRRLACGVSIRCR